MMRVFSLDCQQSTERSARHVVPLPHPIDDTIAPAGREVLHLGGKRHLQPAPQALVGTIDEPSSRGPCPGIHSKRDTLAPPDGFSTISAAVNRAMVRAIFWRTGSRSGFVRSSARKSAHTSSPASNGGSCMSQI